MVQQIVRTLVDDTNPDVEADETVKFSLDGIGYEIDLSNENAQALRLALSPFLPYARRTSPDKQAAKRGKADNAKMREWLTENGWDVPARGRIPVKMVDAYRAKVPAGTHRGGTEVKDQLHPLDEMVAALPD